MEEPGGPSRRGFLGGVGMLGAGAALAGCSGEAPDQASAGSGDTVTVPFHGEHQAGIATPAQDRLAFAALDLTTTDRRDVIELLRTWTAAAKAMTEGKPAPGGASDPMAPPPDTGEARGLPPARLTVTIGFGSSLFDGRFGLKPKRPAALAESPPLPGENLDPDRCGGDLAIQACADDPQVAFHAMRNLARLAMGVAVLRWSQLGFGRTSSTTAAQETPRNLMGFKDGTRNIRSGDTATMDKYVWIGRESDQSWLRGGSYLVARRIAMLIESWDRDYLLDQEKTFGRYKKSGAPLTGDKEFDVPDLSARDSSGRHVIPVDAHIRLASRETNDGTQILRRGYSYTEGIEPKTGELNAGLFFICYQQDPGQFVALQRKLGSQGALTEYIKHTGSAVFACPPGVASDNENDYWGRTLFS